MGEKTERILTIIFYMVLFSVLAALILQNLSSPWILILLSGLLLVSFTFRNAVVYGSQERRGLGKMMFVWKMPIK
jgi:hypothetical protein